MPRVRSIAGSVAANVVATSVGGSVFYGLTINQAGAGAVTITMFDNASASSGTVLFQHSFTAAANGDTLMFSFPTPIVVTNGITATIGTTAVGDISVWVG